MPVVGLGSESSFLIEIESGALRHPDGCGKRRVEWRRPRKAGEAASRGVGEGSGASWILQGPGLEESLGAGARKPGFHASPAAFPV